MKVHLAFSEWENNNVEVFRTFEDGTPYTEIVDVFEHFLSMAYGYPIKLTGGAQMELEIE